MKFRSQAESGSVLMVSVVSAAVMGIMLLAYMDLVNAQNNSVARSLAWNAAIPVVEYGIEEALAHLNQNGDGSLAVDGWSQEGILFSKFRAVGSSQAFIMISNVSPPVIYSHGYSLIPLQTSNYLERVVKVTAIRNSYFRKGILSRGQITLNGNARIDSFDSTDPLYSTNGTYIISKRKAGAGVASNSGLKNIIDDGNARIYGSVSTGPGGSVDIGPNGKVGDIAWVTSSSTSGVQPGAVRDDMNVAFPDVAAPFNSAALPTGGSGYQYIINSSGNWAINSLTGSLLIRSNVNAVLLVTGNINLTGGDQIQIEQGGSLNLYMMGASARIGGNGVANNNTYATNFLFWGLPSNTEVTISGNGAFTGIVYAPQAAYTLNGGGNSGNQDIIGAVVSLTTRINGDFRFHYDESLARANYGRGFTATSWDEL